MVVMVLVAVAFFPSFPSQHMGIPAVIFPPPPSPAPRASTMNYARLVNSTALQVSGSTTSIWLSVPFSPTESCYEIISSVITASDSPSTVGIDLIFPEKDDSQFTLEATLVHLNRLMGLGVKGVTIPTSLFLTNKKGYPTLSKKNQAAIEFLMRRGGDKLRWVFTGERLHFPADEQHQQQGAMATGEDDNGSGFLHYLQYLFHIRSRPHVTSILDNDEARAEKSYLDYLQAPLQPLADNLEFMTYETFEKDPVKYRNYENAALLALRDGVNLGKWGTASSTSTVNIMVVGAGRGPLVQCCLNAVKRYNSSAALGSLPPLTAKILAIEKNANAVVFLHSRCGLEADWMQSVKVMCTDMREAKVSAGDLADIVVSELLGSFGDNELSPECLDGAQRSGLMKDGAVSIPTSYTSYIAPLSSAKLHQEAKAQAYSATDPTAGPMGQPFGFLRAMETPYVVRTFSATQTHPEVSCFEFSHPKGRISESNCRHARAEFANDGSYGLGYGSGYGRVEESYLSLGSAHSRSRSGSSPSAGAGVIVHGLVGSFDCLLYASSTEAGAEERISIAPRNFSVGMFSWFPLFFPLRSAIVVPDEARLNVDVWRMKDDKSIWYEWSAEVVGEKGNVLGTSSVHNVNGRSYKVGL